MPTFIVLPPLREDALSDNTAVTVFHAQQVKRMGLLEALASMPKALLALHPVDAPLHTVNLPPLPLARRMAALRVVLEDALLTDTAQLTLAMQPNGKQRFTVACAATQLLERVHSVLRTAGHANRPVAALLASLPDNSTVSFEQWLLWRDERGSGALPKPLASDASQPVSDSVAPELQAHHLSRAALIFQSRAAAQGSVWLRWRWAALLAALCAAVYTAGVYWHAQQLLVLEKQAKITTQAAFAQALPNTPMIDPVKQLQMASQANALASDLSAALAKVPSDWPSGMVTQLNWAGKRLSLTVNPLMMQLTEAQQQALSASMVSSNIVLIWSKP